MTKKGKVYLIGAGPGDPDLITLKGVDALKRADVILYDFLANNEILLKHAPKHIEKIDVGKRESDISQDEINKMLVDHARRGKIVVRLKGGDPFIFGRGGEEAIALAQAG